MNFKKFIKLKSKGSIVYCEFFQYNEFQKDYKAVSVDNSLEPVLRLAEGSEAKHVCVVLQSGALKCWGYNAGC